MKFGEVLKKIRKEHGDSLRRLAEKTGVVFTYIDKIEKGTMPPNKNLLEKFSKEYPLQKDKLIKSYLEEVFPESLYKNLNVLKKQNDFEVIYSTLFQELSKEEKILQLKNMLDKIEIDCFKNGIYEKNKKKLELIKEKINNL